MKQGKYTELGAGIAIGAGVGTALGVDLNNAAIGIAIGAGVGLVFGMALSQRKLKDDEENSDEDGH